MDKDSIDTTASEYSKSGSDDEASKLDDTAFNSDITSPEAQEDNAGRKADGSVSSSMWFSGLIFGGQKEVYIEQRGCKICNQG